MNSQTRLLFVMLGLQLALVGCKSGSNSNKVTTHRGKPGAGAAAAGKAGAKPEDKKDATTSTGTGSTTTPTRSGTGNSTTTPTSADPTVPTATGSTGTCADYQKRLENDGWEMKWLDTNLSPGQTATKKIRVSYFVQKNSQLKNPVLVLSNSRNELGTKTSENILALAKTHQFDPVYMDVRGYGCSEKLPTTTESQNLTYFTGKAIAHDAESIRRALLKEKTWKVWSSGSASWIGLRMAEVYPKTISGLFVADFTLSETTAELVEARLSKQIDISDEFKKFAKEKDLDLTDEVLLKFKETLKSETCTGSQKICGQNLLNVYLLKQLAGEDDKWLEAVEALKQLKDNKVPSELRAVAQRVQDSYNYTRMIQLVDGGLDQVVTVCKTVEEKTEIKKGLENSLLNSCEMERALEPEFQSQMGTKVRADRVNLLLVKKHLADSKATYFAAFSKRGLTNPITLLDVQKKILGDVFTDDFDSSLDSETFTNEGLLGKMK